MARLVKNTVNAHNSSRISHGQNVETLSDLSTQVCVVRDEINKQYLLSSSAEGYTWTAEATWTQTNDRASPWQTGMCLDESDNVHAFYYNGTNFRYRKATYSAGPNWSWGAEENIVNPAGAPGTADIAILDSGALVFAWIDDGGSGNRRMAYCIRDTGGTWSAATYISLPNVAGAAGEISVCRNTAGATANLQEFAIAGKMQRTYVTVSIVEVNISTGATTTAANNLVTTALDDIEEVDFGIFPVSDDNWVLVGVYDISSSKICCKFFKFDNTTWYGPGATANITAGAISGARQSRTVGFAGGHPYVAWINNGWGAGGDDLIHMIRGDLDSMTFASESNVKISWRQDYLVGKMGKINNESGIAGFTFDVNNAGQWQYWHNAVPDYGTDVPPKDVGPNGVDQVTDLVTLAANCKRQGSIYQFDAAEPEYGPPVHAVWDVAKDSGFTTSLRTIEEDETDWVTNGFSYKEIEESDRLDQDTWYLRAKARDQFGRDSDWASPISSFDVAHPPAVSGLTPDNDVIIEYDTTNRLIWIFSDTNPGDTQTAYQVEVERADLSFIVEDSGKVASADEFFDATLTSAMRGIPLMWRVTVWDEDDVAGPTSDWAFFEARDAPTVAIDDPVGAGTFANPTPTVEWTFTASAQGGSQASWSLTITDDADGSIVYTANGLTNATHTVTDAEVLMNGENYTFALNITDTYGLQASDSVASVEATWTPPTQPEAAISGTSYESDGYIRVTWDDTDEDTYFYSWRVYRKSDGGSYNLIHEEFDTVASSFTYDDYTCPSGIESTYCVVQVADEFGPLIESVRTDHEYTITAKTDYYWLIDTTDSALTFKLHSVVSDVFAEEQEMTEIPIIGRGRVIERGSVLGYRGTLVSHLRGSPDGTLTGREQRELIEDMKRTNREAHLRNPFGDVWKVNLGDISISRIAGVGTSEFSNVTIPYAEVE